jgi:hypothetical protein
LATVATKKSLTNKKREHRSLNSEINLIFDIAYLQIKNPFHLVDNGTDHRGIGGFEPVARTIEKVDGFAELAGADPEDLEFLHQTIW